jgi:G3E family GTPase
MAIATFDTLKFANTLKSFRSRRSAALPRAENPNRMPDKQAQATAFADVIQLNVKDLVTKDELTATEDRLVQKMDAYSLQTRSEITAIGGDINRLRWMIGVGFALGLAILGMVGRLLLR